jgi:hypothetical protein
LAAREVQFRVRVGDEPEVSEDKAAVVLVGVRGFDIAMVATVVAQQRRESLRELADGADFRADVLVCQRFCDRHRLRHDDMSMSLDGRQTKRITRQLARVPPEFVVRTERKARQEAPGRYG